jgi:DNA repair exonuclease SbcCD nuclease subunit
VAIRFRGLFTGDLHMSNSLPYARPAEDGRTDRLNDQLDMFQTVGRYARDNPEIKGAFLNGDTFDKSKPDPVTLVETIGAIRELARIVPVYILPGNHDACNSLKGERFNVELFDHIGDDVDITYMETGSPVHLGDVTFWPIEFMPASETMARVKEMRDRVNSPTYVKAGATNVLLFHNAVVGCQHLSWVCDDGILAEELCEGWDYVIGGHFHTHQDFGPKLNGRDPRLVGHHILHQREAQAKVGRGQHTQLLADRSGRHSVGGSLWGLPPLGG